MGVVYVFVLLALWVNVSVAIFFLRRLKNARLVRNCSEFVRKYFVSSVNYLTVYFEVKVFLS